MVVAIMVFARAATRTYAADEEDLDVKFKFVKEMNMIVTQTIRRSH